jgi:hypothetical protein
MRHYTVALFLIFIIPFSLPAQICGFTRLQNAAIERHTEGYVQKFLQNNIQQRAVARIPVVVHVVWKNDAENISDAQIQSQIDALNRDFRKRNTVNPVFLRFAVDCEIEFCLAKRDTNGNKTTGIERKQSNFTNIDIGSTYFDSVSRRIFYTSKGGANAWNPQQYLNIWVCAFSNGFLGVASSPATALVQPKEDGIVVDYRVFGTIGNLRDGRQNGRIAVHEVGHYLDLLHIWGSDTTCIDDDLVEDTPRQEGPHAGCPVDLLKSCNNSLDYFRNYMDYTNDDCISFFTVGQKARMWASLAGFRATLLNSNMCEPVGITAVNALSFEAYPNPAKSVLTIAFKNNMTSSPKKIQLRDCLGRLVLEKVIYTEGGVDLPVLGLTNGLYFLSLNIDNQLFIKKIVIQK